MSKSQPSYSNHPIFVYGTLKPGGALADTWAKSKGIFMVEDDIIGGNLLNIDNSFPALVPGNTLAKSPGARGVVSGKLLYPNSDENAKILLRRFDIIEGVQQGLYKRVAMKTLYNNVVAWVYIWNDDNYDRFRVVPNGKWINRKRICDYCGEEKCVCGCHEYIWA